MILFKFPKVRGRVKEKLRDKGGGATFLNLSSGLDKKNSKIQKCKIHWGLQQKFALPLLDRVRLG